ncbi:MAG: type 4a pilus biogenesis protein PilO [bacterium]
MIRTKTKFISTVIIIIIATCGITAFIIAPTMKNIKEISSKINNIRLDLEKKYDNRQNLRTVMSRFKKIKQSSEKFSNIYIEKNEELKLITALEGIATDNNLEQNINTFVYQNDDKTAKEKKNELDMQLQITGDYINIIKYFYDLRRLPYYINTKNIVIQSLAASNIKTTEENKNKVEAIIYIDSCINTTGKK